MWECVRVLSWNFQAMLLYIKRQCVHPSWQKDESAIPKGQLKILNNGLRGLDDTKLRILTFGTGVTKNSLSIAIYFWWWFKL